MSGGPPHHPRQNPSANTAWNHSQVSNFFPTRQPQHAHMSNEPSILHQPTWHTPTTEPMKTIPSPHVFNLDHMLADRQFRHGSGVDLSLTRNGSQSNGDLPTTPLSLSVRDANKINSLAVGALDLQAVELTKSHSPSLKAISPGLKSTSPGLKSLSPGLKPMSPGLSISPGVSDKPHGSPKSVKRSNIRVDSILERLNPHEKVVNIFDMEKTPYLQIPDKSEVGFPFFHHDKHLLMEHSRIHSVQMDKSLPIEKAFPHIEKPEVDKIPGQSFNLDETASQEKTMPQENRTIGQDKSVAQSVIVQPSSSSHDENSNSSSIMNVPTPTNVREDDVLSPYSNEDSLDSSKSRRKRKPSKTIRMSKDEKSLEDDIEPMKLQAQFSVLSQFPHTSEPIATETVPPKVVPEIPKCQNTEIKETTNLEPKPIDVNLGELLEGNKIPERRRSSSLEPLESLMQSRKTRRKTSSESETIADIAAMVQEGLDPIKAEEVKAKIQVDKPMADVNLTSASDINNDVKSDKIEGTKSEIKPEHVVKSSEKKADEPVTSTRNAGPNLNAAVSENKILNQPPVGVSVVQTAAQRKATNFVEVENKLEEMFAGIDESLSDPLQAELADPPGDDFITETINNVADSSLIDNLASTSQKDEESILSEVTTPKKSSPKKGKTKSVKGGSRRSSENSLESTPKKKKINKKAKKATPSSSKAAKTPSSGKKTKKILNGKPASNKIDIIKDVYAYDSGSNTSSTKSKGPFIQIKGPRDSPISVNIVNTPTNEDDSERKTNKTKKFHDDTEYRHKVRSKGLHCSTLSNKYDAQTRDISWICVFCKLGPHYNTKPPEYGMTCFAAGDLFGPYIIGTDCPEYERRLEDPYDLQFKSKKISKAIEAGVTGKVTGKKSKRKYSETEKTDNSEIFLGITETGENTYEIWVHEDCIVWSPGVYLVGPKIVGLEEAVWTACNVKCVKCNCKGANVCCLRRGCTNVMHIGCARLSHWQLDEINYKAYCIEHKTV